MLLGAAILVWLHHENGHVGGRSSEVEHKVVTAGNFQSHYWGWKGWSESNV